MTWILFVIAGSALLYSGLMRKKRSWPEEGRASRSVLPVDAEAQFLFCTFSMAAKIIASDGTVTEAELLKLKSFIEDELKLQEKEKAVALRVFQEALASELEIREYALAFRKYFPQRVQLTDKVIVTLLKLAAADGYLSEDEERKIQSAALLLDISAPAFVRLKKEYVHKELAYH